MGGSDILLGSELLDIVAAEISKVRSALAHVERVAHSASRFALAQRCQRRCMADRSPQAPFGLCESAVVMPARVDVAQGDEAIQDVAASSSSQTLISAPPDSVAFVQIATALPSQTPEAQGNEHIDVSPLGSSFALALANGSDAEDQRPARQCMASRRGRPTGGRRGEAHYQ